MTYYSGYRWANGTKTSAQMTVTYAIEDFPRQSDMKSSWNWTRPQSPADLVFPAALKGDLEGDLGAYGELELLWEFPFWTSAQIDYIFDNLFGGAYSALQTIRTYDRQNHAWLVLNVKARWPEKDVIAGLVRRGGGFVDFPIRFIKGVTAS
jgi:hypothetical protein